MTALVLAHGADYLHAWQALLLFGGTPLVIFGLIALLVYHPWSGRRR